MKKHIYAIICLIIISVVSAVLLYFTVNVGETSGTIKLFVDDTEMAIDGVPVAFSFTDGSNGNKFSDSRYLKNGGFRFRKSQYAVYYISFSLNPNIWGDTGQDINFEIQYFCSYNKAITEFYIQLNVESEEVKTIELIAADVGSPEISSGKIPIDPLGMDISVYIPSP